MSPWQASSGVVSLCKEPAKESPGAAQFLLLGALDSKTKWHITKLLCRREEAALTLCEVMGLVLPKPDSEGTMQWIGGWRVEEHRLTGTLREAAERSSPIQPQG